MKTLKVTGKKRQIPQNKTQNTIRLTKNYYGQDLMAEDKGERYPQGEEEE